MSRPAPMDLRDGHLVAPHGVFIRGGAGMGDADVFASLGLTSCVTRIEDPAGAPPGPEAAHLIYVARRSGWLQLMDDWSLSMLRHPVRPRVRALGANRELFTFSGHDGRWFEFLHYQGGELQREYEEQWSQLDGLEVVLDIGEPLPGEARARRARTYADRGAKLASAIGVDMRHEWDALRVYEYERGGGPSDR